MKEQEVRGLCRFERNWRLFEGARKGVLISGCFSFLSIISESSTQMEKRG